MKKGSVKGRDIGKISDVDINVDCVVHVHHDSMRRVVRKNTINVDVSLHLWNCLLQIV